MKCLFPPFNILRQYLSNTSERYDVVFFSVAIHFQPHSTKTSVVQLNITVPII